MKAAGKWSAYMLFPHATIFPKWQHLHCLQNITGEMERDHMDVKYTALGFIGIHPAGTVNEVILYFASRRCTWAR